MRALRVGALPDAPLAAATQFHIEVLPLALAAMEAGRDLLLIFGAADHTHRDWRLGAVRGLARLFAPGRVNALASDDETAIAAATDYIARAPGVTGQLLPLDGTGAGPVLYQA